MEICEYFFQSVILTSNEKAASTLWDPLTAVARFATIGCEYRMKAGAWSLEIYGGYRLIASDWRPHAGKN